ncbi:MAG: VOC family protein [SAR202 cluster bacterium]|nr:VOC family protein [SAR202 cluster bacterium]
MVRDLAGVILWTEDVTRLAAFYRDVLGLKVHSDHGDFVAFDIRPGVRLSVGRHDRVRGRSTEPFRVMVNLAVEDIHAMHRTLASKGVAFLRPPEREAWGGLVATFQDPDGNTLQLFQLPNRD